MIEHVPTETIVTMLPDRVQTGVVVEANVTASPEVAVAPMVNGPAPNVRPLSAANRIVCTVGPVTVKLCVTGVAAA